MASVLELFALEREAAEFHDVTAFDRLAELVVEFTARDRSSTWRVRLHTDSWKGQDGSLAAGWW
jgi:single-stranded DNA-binding protein